MPGHAKAAYWAVGLYRTPRRIVAQLQQTAHGLSLPQKVPGRRNGRGPLTSRRFTSSGGALDGPQKASELRLMLTTRMTTAARTRRTPSAMRPHVGSEADSMFL